MVICSVISTLARAKNSQNASDKKSDASGSSTSTFGILDFEARALNLLIMLCRFYIYKTKMEQGVLQY